MTQDHNHCFIQKELYAAIVVPIYMQLEIALYVKELSIANNTVKSSSFYTKVIVYCNCHSRIHAT